MNTNQKSTSPYTSPSKQINSELDEFQNNRDILLLKCKQSIEDLQLEVEQLSQQKIELDTKNNELEKDLYSEQEQILALQAKIDESNQIIAELESQLQAEGQKGQQLMFQVKEGENLISSLTSQLEIAEQFKNMYADMNDKFNGLNEEKCSLEAQLEQAHQNYKKLKDEWAGTIDITNKRVRLLEAENDQLKTDTKRKADQIYELERKVLQLETQNKLNEKLKLDLQQAKQQSESNAKKLNEYKLLNQQLQQDNDGMLFKIKQIELEIQEQMQAKDLQHTQEIQDMQDQFETQEQQLKKDQINQINELQNSLDLSNQSIERLKAEVRNMEQDNSQLQQNIKDKNEQMNYLQKNYIEKMQKNISEQQAQLKTLQNKVEDLNGLLKQKDDLITKLQQETSMKIASINEMTDKNRNLNSKLEEYQEQLKQINEDFSKQCENEELKQMEMKEKIQQLEQMLDDRNNSVGAQGQEIIRLRDDLRSNTQLCNQLQLEKCKLQDSLKQKSIEADQLEKQLSLERNKRIQQQDVIKEYNERLHNQDTQHHREIRTYQEEIQKKDQQIFNLKNKYEKSVNQILDKLNQPKQIMSKHRSPDLHQNRQVEFSDHQQTDQNEPLQKNQLQQYLSHRDATESSGQPLPNQMFSTTQKQFTTPSHPQQNRTEAKNPMQDAHIRHQSDYNIKQMYKNTKNTQPIGIKTETSTGSLNHFNQVISRLEQKLDRMQSEINFKKLQITPKKHAHQ